MGIFAQHAPAYVDAGVPAFPVNTREKRPAVKGWQKTTASRTRAWAADPRLGDADGLGISVGESTGLTEIDVDAVGEAWLAAAIEWFGETPITIATASGKAKLWYRNNGEGRRIRPFKGQPIDVLGGGFTVAPPSWREDLGAEYKFRTGGLEEIDNLPTIASDALEGFTRRAGGIHVGKRNDTLWRYCMAQARHCDDVEALLDVAETWAGAFPDPLPHAEIERCARSAWRYEEEGRNYLGLKRPQVTKEDVIMDDLIDHPEALTLYQLFVRWHSNRASFAIAPTAMSAAKNPPWHRTRIIRARDVLLERGFIEEVKAPARGRRAGQYRLTPQIADTGKDHYTPFSPGGEAAGSRRQAGGKQARRAR